MAEAHAAMRAALHLASADLHSFFGAYDSAIGDFNQLQELSAPSLRTELEFARTCIEAKRFKDAALFLKKLIEKHPTSIAGHTLLGLALFSEGKTSSAKDAWKKTLEYNPHAKDARVFLDILSVADR